MVGTADLMPAVARNLLPPTHDQPYTSSGLVFNRHNYELGGYGTVCRQRACTGWQGARLAREHLSFRGTPRRGAARHSSGLLQSITRVEAGRKTVTGEFMPWAWTLNDAGEGLFFDSARPPCAISRRQCRARHSVDVGCMQVNTKWHMEGFHNLSDMLDPVQNADYAAGFLLDLHEAHQSWDDAVKHYHSSEPGKNVAYHGRVLAELERFLADNDDAKAIAALPVTNPANQINEGPVPAQDDTEMALIERPVTLPDTQPAIPAATPLRAAVPVTPSPPADSKADDLSGQPNLAPHRDRVEHFRKLLARQPG